MVNFHYRNKVEKKKLREHDFSIFICQMFFFFLRLLHISKKAIKAS